jgi:hypothetical protein
LDVEADSLHVKRIDIENLVSYIYIVRVDILSHVFSHIRNRIRADNYFSSHNEI